MHFSFRGKTRTCDDFFAESASPLLIERGQGRIACVMPGVYIDKMRRVRHCTGFFVLILVLVQSSCALHSFLPSTSDPVIPANGYVTLGKLPFHEAWYGMYFQTQKVGYSHFKIEPASHNFSINTDSFMRLKALRKVNEVKMRERVVVRPEPDFGVVPVCSPHER